MKFTFIGFFMRRSCWITRLDTETTRGLIGCRDAEIGVYSWPCVMGIVPSRRVTSASPHQIS